MRGSVTGCAGPSASDCAGLRSEMEPLSLAETLRKERQFVHRVLEDVRDTNDTIRDLLAELHVEAWANYQLSGRLAAGTAFVKHSSVEWPLIIQHLASAKLAPLRKPSDLDIAHVSAYLDRLRNQANLAADMLLFVHDKGLDAPQLVRDLISSVYGQLLLPEDATCCQEVIRSLASAAVTRCAHPRVLLQGHESMFTSMFAEYAEHETAMRSFLSYTLQPAVVQAVAESSRIMEVDMCMAVLRLSEGTTTDLDEDITRITVEEHVAWASRKLKMIMNTLFGSLCTSLPMLPRFAAELLHLLQSSVAARWDVRQEDPLMTAILVTYLLDMMVIPALVNPDRFGIVPSVCLEQRVRYNLTQLASLLHSVAKVIESRALGKERHSTVPQSNALLIVSSLDLVRAGRVEGREGRGTGGWRAGRVEGREGGGQGGWRAGRVEGREGGGQGGWRAGRVEGREGREGGGQGGWRAGRAEGREGGGTGGWRAGRVEGTHCFGYHMLL